MQYEIKNLTSKEAWDLLTKDDAYLVDVRTKHEWENIGIPDISKCNKIVLQLTLRNEDMSMNENFLVELEKSIPDQNSSHVIFICKSGGRSAIAASLAIQAGYKYCYNIVDGFEGSSYGVGWKKNQLPYIKDQKTIP